MPQTRKYVSEARCAHRESWMSAEGTCDAADHSRGTDSESNQVILVDTVI